MSPEQTPLSPPTPRSIIATTTLPIHQQNASILTASSIICTALAGWQRWLPPPFLDEEEEDRSRLTENCSRLYGPVAEYQLQFGCTVRGKRIPTCTDSPSSSSRLDRAQHQHNEGSKMASPGTVCDTCASEGAICDIERHFPCTSCHNNKKQCGFSVNSSTTRRPSLSSSRTASVDSNLQSQPSQTPSYQSPTSSRAPTPARKSPFNSTDSSPLSKPDHPEMPSKGSPQFDCGLEGLEGLQQRDAPAYTGLKRKRSTMHPALPARHRSLRSSTRLVPHERTDQSPVLTFNAANEAIQQGRPGLYKGTTPPAAPPASNEEDVPLTSRNLPNPDDATPQENGAVGKGIAVAKPAQKFPSPEMLYDGFSLDLHARLITNHFIEITKVDGQSGNLCVCPLKTYVRSDCCPNDSRPKEDIVSHCIEKHPGYTIIQSLRIFSTRVTDMCSEDIQILRSDYRRFEQTYGSLSSVWQRWSSVMFKCTAKAGTWSLVIEATVKKLLHEAHVETLRKAGGRPGTPAQAGQAIQEVQASPNGQSGAGPSHKTTATAGLIQGQVGQVPQAVQASSNAQSVAGPFKNNTATAALMQGQVGQARQAVQVPPNGQSFTKLVYSNTPTDPLGVREPTMGEFFQMLDEVNRSRG